MDVRWTHRARRAVAPALAVAAIAALAPPAMADVPQPDCNSSAIWGRTGSGFYESNPTYTDPRDDTPNWTISNPAAENMNKARMDTGTDSLARNRSLLSVLIIRHGKLAYERYFNGGAVNKANNIHSASKSILQALIGIAVQKGKITSIDDKASKYLLAAFTGQPQWKQDITIKQLLAMTSRLSWVEEAADGGPGTEQYVEGTSDWVKAIIARPGQYPGWPEEPTNMFNYSTGNTHVLSGVLQAAAGTSTCTFAGTNLFGKLGLAVEHWGRDPKAVYSGGYNVYMTPRELAKFGQLYLRNGVWNGQQLVPAATVAQARTQISHDPEDPEFGYSQGWWTRTIAGHSMFFGWGWGGQFLYVIPDLDLVFSTTEKTADGWNNVEINSGDFIRDVILPSITGP